MMKKLLVAVLFVCASLNLFAQDTVLLRLAVVEFSGNAPDAAATVREMVERVMIDSGKFDIVDTNNIDQIIAQQRIALSSISSTENITKLKRENIKYIVTGTVRKQGTESFVSLKILDVSNAVFIPNSPGGVVDMSSMTSIYRGVSDISSDFLSGMSGSGGIVRTYRIGGTGPAGGIVFYDKGVFSAGWRYLEVAPEETEWQGVFDDVDYGKVKGTSTAIGSGKRNTQIIISYLTGIGENRRSAQLCANLDFNGFKDWFLPSKDELDLIYKNLWLNRLGGFTNDGMYWSSSVNIWGDYLWGLRFEIYDWDGNGRIGTDIVRAVRAF